MISVKNRKIFAGIGGGIVLILGLLWYFQQQGFLKVFPTREDRRIKKILVIDESKFHGAEGLQDSVFKEKVKEVYDLRKQVEASPKDAKVWFDFGYGKEFLNDHAGAVAAWEESFALQPMNFVTAQNLANNYQYFLKDYNRAEFYYQKALEIQPAYTAAYQGLADLYRFNWKEKQDKFEPLLLAAVKNDAPNSDKYYALLVEFFAASGILDKANAYLQEVQAINSNLAKELVNQYPKLK